MKRSLFIVAILIATLASQTPAQEERRWSARLAEGFSQLGAGKTDEALAIFEEVEALARQAGDDRSLGEALRGRGRVYMSCSKTADMTAAYAEAMARFDAAGDARGSGQVRSDMGFAAWQRGDAKATLDFYTQSADIFERAGLKAELAGALRNMTFTNMPVTQKVASLERALVIAAEIGDRRVQGLILHALGDTASGLDDQQGALDRYEQALPLLETANDPAVLARLLTSFGRLHRIHGDPAAAIRYYERTIELLRSTTDRDGERQAEDALAIALTGTGRAAEALKHAERSLELARQSRPLLVAYQQLRVGEIALLNNDLERALAMLAVPQTTPLNEAGRRTHLADALLRKGELERAFGEANAAITVAEPLNWEARVGAYDVRSRVHEAAGRWNDAAADAVTSVSILESVRGSLVTSDSFRASFSDGYRRFYDRAVSLQDRNGQQQQAYQTAESGRARALLDLIGTREQPIAEPTVAPGEVVIAYWTTRNATFAWVVDHTGITLAKRIDVTRTALDALVTESQTIAPTTAGTLRGAQPSAVFDRDPRPSLRRIHDTLFAPLRSAIGHARRIVIVPDGPLLGMSFAELIDAKGRYLVEDFTLQYAPSQRLSAKRSSTPQPDAAALLVSVSSGYPKSLGVTLGPLPGATREVDAIMPLFQRGTATRVSESQATEAHVREAIAHRRVVHFATHAIASREHPAESFLALRAGGGHDGRLTAAEISTLPIDADLVVLSACRGAAGRVSGEGMLGLSRALLGAGAHALLASVRELPDEAAAEMLPAFYRSWRRSGDAAAALRTAQLARLKRLRSGQVRVSTPFGPVVMPEHPALWSGLVLIGEK